MATVTLDSPANRNALSRQLVTELVGHVERAGSDADVRVVLIESSGKVFCSGADLTEASSEGMESGTRAIVDLQRLITTLDKPVVTKNLGAVRAGGIGIIAAADIAISADDATFALTEVKLGLAAAIISLTVHHDTPGRRRSPRSAARCSAPEAAATRLVTKAVPADHLDDEVATVCASLATGAPRGCASPSGSSTATWWRASTRSARRWPRPAPGCSPPTRHARRWRHS